MASAMPVDSSENLQLSQRNDGPEPATIARDPYQEPILPLYIIANKKKRLLIEENVFLDLFAIVFEEYN